MNESLKKFTDQLNNIWKGMDFTAKLLTGSFTIAAVVGLIAWASWIQKEEYGLLHSGRDTKEVGEIVNYLRDHDIDYQIKDGGKAIYVPANRMYDTKLNLATEGLLDDKVGFEMFDSVKFGMTSFAQKVNFRRALQGELAKIISELDPISVASVQVVVPEPSLFVEDKKQPTASIVLKLKSRRLLNANQISGIVQLVSSAVEGLEEKNVTIADSTGKLLTLKDPSTSMLRNSDHLELRERIEKYYISKATEIISKVLGSNSVVVQVSAEMEYEDVDEKHIVYDPDGKVPSSQRIITRVSGGQSGGRTGSPGTDANVRQVGLVQELQSSEEEETVQTQYDTSRVERLVSRHGGVLERLTVAILVDGKYESEEVDGVMQKKYVPLADSTLKNLGALVKNALGISDARGDSLEVKNLQFSDELITPVTELAEVNPYIQMVMDNISFIITLLTFVIFALIIVKKMRVKVKEQVLRIEQGLPGDIPIDVKSLTKEQLRAKKLVESGVGITGESSLGAEGDIAQIDSEGNDDDETAWAGNKGTIKSAALREVLKRPSKEINRDLEIFKEDIRRQIRGKVDGAAGILRKWLAQ